MKTPMLYGLFAALTMLIAFAFAAWAIWSRVLLVETCFYEAVFSYAGGGGLFLLLGSGHRIRARQPVRLQAPLERFFGLGVAAVVTVGFHLATLPFVWAGSAGAPRRYALHFIEREGLQTLVSVGALLLLIGIVWEAAMLAWWFSSWADPQRSGVPDSHPREFF